MRLYRTRWALILIKGGEGGGGRGNWGTDKHAERMPAENEGGHRVTFLHASDFGDRQHAQIRPTASGGSEPAGPLTVDFWTPELGGSNVCC